MADTQGGMDVAGLVAEHYQAIYRYAYRLCGSAHSAEDLTQQTFLAAQRKLGQVRNIGSVRSWLYAILRNHFLKMCNQWQAPTAADLELNLDTIPLETPAEEEIDRERLQEALDQLEPTFRVVLVMFYFEQCSYKEIAAALELPMGTVMSRLARAKGHLRSKLFELSVAGSQENA